MSPLRVLAYPQRLSPCWGRGGLLVCWWTYPATVVADLADAGAPSDTPWLPIMLEPRVLAAWKVVAPRVEPLCCRRCCAPAPSRPRLWPCLLCGWSPQRYFLWSTQKVLCCPHLFISWCRVGYKNKKTVFHGTTHTSDFTHKWAGRQELADAELRFMRLFGVWKF